MVNTRKINKRKRSNRRIIALYQTFHTSKNNLGFNLVWDGSIFLCLLVIAVLGMMASICIHKIMQTYAYENVFVSNAYFDEKNSSFYSKEHQEQPWNHRYNLTQNKTENPDNGDNKSEEDKYMQEIDDLHFIHFKRLCFHRTVSDSTHPREYFLFYPIFSTAVAISWCLVIYNFKADNNWSNRKHWIIVVPSIILYTFMLAGAIMYYFQVRYYFGLLCNIFKMQLNHPSEFSCGYLLDNIHMHNRSWIQLNFSMPPSRYYELYTWTNIADIILWSFSFVITFIRFLNGADFDFVNVIISIRGVQPNKLKTNTPKIESNNPHPIV